MYRENILEHYKNPDHYGNLEDYNAVCNAHNPSCGDEIEIKLKIVKGKIKNAKFQAKGCAISLASADILLDNIKEKPLNEIKKLNERDLFKLLNVEITPARINCALLALNALKKIK
jgi:nitrogen fixation NifU-like protein